MLLLNAALHRGKDNGDPNGVDVFDDDNQWDEMLVSNNFDIGNTGAAKSKRSRLLCTQTGVTDVNWGLGLNSGMYVLLTPTQRDLKLLQTTKAPV